MAYQDDVVTSIGAKLKIGTNEVQGVFNIGALGADPSELNVTPLPSRYAIKVPGLIDLPAWEFQYYHNRTDFNMINTAMNAGTSIDVTVELPNGDKFTNTGIIASNYVTDIAGAQGIQCKASITLGSVNGWTYTAGE